jgi:hypothetical protein
VFDVVPSALCFSPRLMKTVSSTGSCFESRGLHEPTVISKTDMEMSIDGEPFKTYGRVMYEKHMPH